MLTDKERLEVKESVGEKESERERKRHQAWVNLIAY